MMVICVSANSLCKWPRKQSGCSNARYPRSAWTESVLERYRTPCILINEINTLTIPNYGSSFRVNPPSNRFRSRIYARISLPRALLTSRLPFSALQRNKENRGSEHKLGWERGIVKTKNKEERGEISRGWVRLSQEGQCSWRRKRHEGWKNHEEIRNTNKRVSRRRSSSTRMHPSIP